MKRISYAVLYIGLISLLLYFATLFICKELNEEAEAAIREYDYLVKEFKARSGSYPESLQEQKTPRKRVLFVFEPLEVIYTHKDAPELWYAQLPLGPLRVYNLATEEWSFAE